MCYIIISYEKKQAGLSKLLTFRLSFSLFADSGRFFQRNLWKTQILFCILAVSQSRPAEKTEKTAGFSCAGYFRRGRERLWIRGDRLKAQVYPTLNENIAEMKKSLPGDNTLIQREFAPRSLPGLRCCLFCIDGMVSSEVINEAVLRPVTLLSRGPESGEDAAEFLQRQVLQSCESKPATEYAEILRAVLYGDSVLFVEGCRRALLLGTKGFLIRSVSEPSGETYLKGPREGFVEPLLHNLAMLRRRLRTPDLKLEYFTLGTTTKTDCCLCYLDSAVDRAMLSLLRQRLARIAIDGVLDSNYVAELVRDHRWSLFRTTGSSERPDIVASKLMEGRAAILVDGSPVAVTVPFIFLEHFQSGEDYYVSYSFAGINRFLRVAGFFVAISILPIYLSLVTFHQAFMPLSLILSIARARQDIPFPILMEAILLLLAFDILREAGVRTPSTIGQTLSVVGGLVIGQAAVDARLVSVPVLIVVAISGICALIAPKLKAAVVICRLALMVLGVSFGFYGYLLGMLGLMALLSRQHSFGINYLAGLPLEQTDSAEDSILRTPYWLMRKYGRFLAGKGKGRR